MQSLRLTADESSYFSFAEYFIKLCVEKLFSIEGIEDIPILDIFSRVEDYVHNKAIEKSGNKSNLSEVWRDQTALVHYRDLCDTIVGKIDNSASSVDLKKVLKQCSKSVDPLINLLLKSGGQSKSEKVAKGPRSASKPSNILKQPRVAKTPLKGKKPALNVVDSISSIPRPVQQSVNINPSQSSTALSQLQPSISNSSFTTSSDDIEIDLIDFNVDNPSSEDKEELPSDSLSVIREKERLARLAAEQAMVSDDIQDDDFL